MHPYHFRMFDPVYCFNIHGVCTMIAKHLSLQSRLYGCNAYVDPSPLVSIPLKWCVVAFTSSLNLISPQSTVAFEGRLSTPVELSLLVTVSCPCLSGHAERFGNLVALEGGSSGAGYKFQREYSSECGACEGS